MKLIKLIGWFDARTFWSQKSAFGNSNRLSPELLRSSSCSFTEWLQQMHQLDVCAFIKTFTATTPPSSFPLSQFHQPTFTFTNPLAQVRRGTCLSTVNSNLIHCLVFSFTIVNHPPILSYNFGCVVKNMNMEFLCFCLSSFCNKTICGTSCSWLEQLSDPETRLPLWLFLRAPYSILVSFAANHPIFHSSINISKKMLENRPEATLGSLVKLVRCWKIVPNCLNYTKYLTLWNCEIF